VCTDPNWLFFGVSQSHFGFSSILFWINGTADFYGPDVLPLTTSHLGTHHRVKALHETQSTDPNQWSTEAIC